jgi:micrococcal nuclease
MVELAIAILFPAVPLAIAGNFSGKDIGVTDGDTITVLHDHRPEKIRLNGIDAPEKGQPFAEKFRQFTTGLAFGQDVTVRVTGRDRYGRTIAGVILNAIGVSLRDRVGAGRLREALSGRARTPARWE